MGILKNDCPQKSPVKILKESGIEISNNLNHNRLVETHFLTSSLDFLIIFSYFRKKRKIMKINISIEEFCQLLNSHFLKDINDQTIVDKCLNRYKSVSVNFSYQDAKIEKESSDYRYRKKDDVEPFKTIFNCLLTIPCYLSFE